MKIKGTIIEDFLYEAGAEYGGHQIFIDNPQKYIKEHIITDNVNYGIFAELIIQECLSMCKTSVGNADYNTGKLHCINNIRERFGLDD